MAGNVKVPPICVDLETVASLTTLSPSTIQGMVSKKSFPAPRELSGRRVAWLYREVMAWAESRPESDLLPPQKTGAEKTRKPIPPAPPGSQDMSKVS